MIYLEKNQITDSNLKSEILNAYYLTCSIGTFFEYDILIDGMSDNNQRIEYKYKVSIAKQKYTYLKNKYKVDLKNHEYLNFDFRVRKIYTLIKIIIMGICAYALNTKIFCPSYEIKVIHFIDICIALKDNLDTKINQVSISKFKQNKNIKIQYLS